MSFDREEFERLQRASLRDVKAEHQIAHLRVARQAAVTGSKLLGDPHWNAFVQMLQAEIEELRKRAESERDKALGNKPIDPAKREAHRIEALLAASVADALERVQGYPAQLVKQGREADQLLLEVEKSA